MDRIPHTPSSSVQLSTICPKLHSVSLAGCFRLTDDAIEVLARNCQGTQRHDELSHGREEESDLES